MSSPGNLRLMQERDIPSVLNIQAESYLDVMQEAEVVIRSRFVAAPGTAWVVETNNRVCAYLVGYISTPGVVSAWGGEFSHNLVGRTLYIHDIALSREVRGLGMGHWLVDQVLTQARLSGIDSAALVAVQCSQSFWRKMGFDIYADLSPSQNINLNTYAGDAFYMMRRLV